MKKLIIACAAVLVLGLGLTTVGHVLGGQFYSVYYNGALHPFSDAARDFSDTVENIRDHYVSPDDEIDSDYDTGWVQDYLETRKASMKDYDLPMQTLDHITDIELTLKGSNFSLASGGDFALTDDVTVTESTFRNGKWTAELWANDDEVSIILPNSVQRWHTINISCTQSANLSIPDLLRADNLTLSTENGTLTAKELSAEDIELYTNTGTLSALLPEAADRYHVQARTNGGPVSLNGAVLVQLDEAGNGTAQYDNSYDPETNSYRVDRPYTAEFTVSGAGRISVLTQVTPTGADTANRTVT